MGVIIGWITDILRTIFFFIDQIVYFLIDKVYSLFLEIASTTLFTKDIIDQFADKVYALVGIFMLFKVSFSILTYIVNPDEFTDKNKGLNKLVSNILISLVLLLAVPVIFSEAMDIQRIILKDDIIPKMLSTSEINISSQDPGQGSEMALITFQTFYNGPGTTLGQIFSTDVNAKDNAGNYTYEYDLLISTAVGIVMILLLISFCFDIALRSIKLGFLRMLAPIPIIARVDPKKGNEVFNKWVKTCVSTYLDLFMRLLAIFFAIFVIKLMQQTQFVDAVTDDVKTVSGLTMVFIILGALMFAKQLPKLVEDLLGIKLSGNFTLNPMKKIDESVLGGKRITGAAGGLLARGLPGMLSGFKNGEGFIKTRDAEVARRHALQTARDNGSTWQSRLSERYNHALGLDTEVDRLNRRENEINNEIANIDRAQEAGRNQIARNKAVTDAYKTVEDRALERIKEGAAGDLSREYLRRQENINNLRAQMQEAATSGNTAVADRLAEQIANETMSNSNWLESARDTYIDARGAVAGAGGVDQAIAGMMDTVHEQARVNGVHIATTAHGIHGDVGRLKGDNTRISNSFIDQDRQKSTYEEEKKRISEQKRIAQANLNAINSSGSSKK